MSVISQHRGDHNRLGFAVQLCYLRYPGTVLPTKIQPPNDLLNFVAKQIYVDKNVWDQYAKREETRREHLLELQRWMKLTAFDPQLFKQFVLSLTELAKQTDKGVVLATSFLESLRQQRIIVPSIDVITRICAKALTNGTKQVYAVLTKSLSIQHKRTLDNLLSLKETGTMSILSWLQQPAGMPNAKHVLAHIERLRTIRDIELPKNIASAVHQNRLLKLSREGGQMTAQHLRDLEENRRYATLVAVVILKAKINSIARKEVFPFLLQKSFQS